MGKGDSAHGLAELPVLVHSGRLRLDLLDARNHAKAGAQLALLLPTPTEWSDLGRASADVDQRRRERRTGVGRKRGLERLAK